MDPKEDTGLARREFLYFLGGLGAANAIGLGTWLTLEALVPKGKNMLKFEAVPWHHTVNESLAKNEMSCLNCHGLAHPTRASRTPGSPDYARLMGKAPSGIFAGKPRQRPSPWSSHWSISGCPVRTRWAPSHSSPNRCFSWRS
jgi:hypothetical protein